MLRAFGAVGAWSLALVAAGCSGGPSSDPAPSPGSPGASSPGLDAVVAEVRDRVRIYDGIATGVIALVRVGDRTEVITRGSADVAAERRITPDETFPIASVTKPMVATLVMRLVEQGRIALDDDVRDLLPQLSSLDRPVTVEHLLSHRSGLTADPRPADVRRWGTADTTHLVTAGAGEGLRFRPGSDGRYSNLGFAALGLLVEKVEHKPLGRALSDHVFQPAGMVDSSLAGDPEVQGYSGPRPVRNYFLDYLPGAGSVVSNVRDVDAFFQHLWAGGLVPPGAVAEMRRSRGQVEVGLGFSPEYGLGLMHLSTPCGVAIGHSGRIGGFTIEAWTRESGERSTVVAINDQGADEIARSVAVTALCGG
jgi:D-alanyl-D-alanine carboxypeptidase